jgi:hypothetical protein
MNYNDIDKNILMKYLELACFEDIEKKYSQQNYNVYREYKLKDNIYADIVAVKENEMVIFEIRYGNMLKEQKKRFYAIKEFVGKQNKNIKFKMIFLNPPQSKIIEFDGLSQIIFDDLYSQAIPDELDALSTHTRLEEITEIEIDSLEIKDEYIYVQGNGVLEVSLQFGSDSESEDDEDYFDEYPFKFKLQLNKEFKIEDSEYDISSYDV